MGLAGLHFSPEEAPMPDTPTDATDLPLTCPACGGELHALVGPVAPQSRPVAWSCPHCQQTHQTDFGGPLYGIVKR